MGAGREVYPGVYNGERYTQVCTTVRGIPRVGRVVYPRVGRVVGIP